MSIQDALRFISYLHHGNQPNTHTEGLLLITDIVSSGQAEGFHFDEKELRLAFKHDWAMRYFRFKQKEPLIR